MEKVIIPPPPKPEEVTQKERQYLEEWKTYFKSAHPRIIVVSPGDEQFDLKKFENAAKFLSHGDSEGVELVDWPSEAQIAFVVSLDSSTLSEQKKKFLADRTRIFCYGNIAFGLDYFNDQIDWNKETFQYGLGNWTDDLLSWNFIAERLMDDVKELEDRVPLLSKK